jgi:uncharacterized membrane protein (DUF2068 family)
MTGARLGSDSVKTRSKRPKETGILLIGIFKLVKGILLVAVGLGALRLLHRDLAALITHWVEVLKADPDNRYIHRLVERAFSVSPRQLKELSVGTFFYASLLLTEGVGLLLRKHWAEYFTVITTTALIPLEIYELIRRFTFTRVGVLALNVAIVWYLVRRLRTGQR